MYYADNIGDFINDFFVCVNCCMNVIVRESKLWTVYFPTNPDYISLTISVQNLFLTLKLNYHWMKKKLLFCFIHHDRKFFCKGVIIVNADFFQWKMNITLYQRKLAYTNEMFGWEYKHLSRTYHSKSLYLRLWCLSIWKGNKSFVMYIDFSVSMMTGLIVIDIFRV